MPKFSGPEHITTIFLTSGPIDAVDGVIETDRVLDQNDLNSLAQYGFTPAADAPSPAPSATTSPAKTGPAAAQASD